MMLQCNPSVILAYSCCSFTVEGDVENKGLINRSVNILWQITVHVGCNVVLHNLRKKILTIKEESEIR